MPPDGYSSLSTVSGSTRRAVRRCRRRPRRLRLPRHAIRPLAINTAPAEEVAQVRHLERDVAGAIVTQRPFADFAALTVPGVPVAALEKLRDAIVF